MTENPYVRTNNQKSIRPLTIGGVHLCNMDRSDHGVRQSTMTEDGLPLWRSWERLLPKPLIGFVYTALFCVGIGITNWLLDYGVTLADSLMVSLCIGLSINSMFVFFQDACETYMSPYVAAIPLTGVGLVIGLLLAGTLVISEPLFFFTNDYTTLVFGVFFGILGFILFSTRARLMETQARLAEAKIEQEKQSRLILQTELKLLQAQIEPHFLFNTLSNIAGLIHTKPDVAEETLLNLTTLLRSSLSRTRQSETTLKDELDIARAYLEIHKTRMQGRLEYEIETPPEDIALFPVPPLLVQPLVENAIKHGIDPKEDGGTVTVSIERESDTVQIKVADDGAGIGSTHSGSGSGMGGTGLSNVRNRLSTLYGPHASLSLRERSTGGVIAELSLPRET